MQDVVETLLGSEIVDETGMFSCPCWFIHKLIANRAVLDRS